MPKVDGIGVERMGGSGWIKIKGFIQRNKRQVWELSWCSGRLLWIPHFCSQGLEKLRMQQARLLVCPGVTWSLTSEEQHWLWKSSGRNVGPRSGAGCIPKLAVPAGTPLACSLGWTLAFDLPTQSKWPCYLLTKAQQAILFYSLLKDKLWFVCNL